MLAYSFPLLNAFWTLLWFFLFVIWIWLLISILADIFRSHDMSGWAKAGWLAFLIFLPFLGVLVYLIARGSKMHQHAVADAVQAQQQMDDYVRSTAGQSMASELAQLAQLRDSGAISQEEYDKAKAKALG